MTLEMLPNDYGRLQKHPLLSNSAETKAQARERAYRRSLEVTLEEEIEQLAVDHRADSFARGEEQNSF